MLICVPGLLCGTDCGHDKYVKMFCSLVSIVCFQSAELLSCSFLLGCFLPSISGLRIPNQLCICVRNQGQSLRDFRAVGAIGCWGIPKVIPWYITLANIVCYSMNNMTTPHRNLSARIPICSVRRESKT